MTDEDRQVCKICQAYFVRPWRQTNKCCSEECSTINRKTNERNRRRGNGAPRYSESLERQLARKSSDRFLERLQAEHPKRAVS